MAVRNQLSSIPASVWVLGSRDFLVSRTSKMLPLGNLDEVGDGVIYVAVEKEAGMSVDVVYNTVRRYLEDEFVYHDANLEGKG